MTKDEQANRFERRKTDPLRQWKLSEIDMQAQERWDEALDYALHHEIAISGAREVEIMDAQRSRNGKFIG